MSKIREITKLTLLTPGALSILAFYGLVIATRMQVGHWPYYHFPDAGVLSSVPFPWWHGVVTILFIATVSSGIIGLPFALAGNMNRSKWIRTFSLLCVATCAMVVALSLLIRESFLIGLSIEIGRLNRS